MKLREHIHFNVIHQPNNKIYKYFVLSIRDHGYRKMFNANKYTLQEVIKNRNRLLKKYGETIPTDTELENEQTFTQAGEINQS